MTKLEVLELLHELFCGCYLRIGRQTGDGDWETDTTVDYERVTDRIYGKLKEEKSNANP